MITPPFSPEMQVEICRYVPNSDWKTFLTIPAFWQSRTCIDVTKENIALFKTILDRGWLRCDTLILSWNLKGKIEKPISKGFRSPPLGHSGYPVLGKRRHSAGPKGRNKRKKITIYETILSLLDTPRLDHVGLPWNFLKFPENYQNSIISKICDKQLSQVSVVFKGRRYHLDIFTTLSQNGFQGKYLVEMPNLSKQALAMIESFWTAWPDNFLDAKDGNNNTLLSFQARLGKAEKVDFLLKNSALKGHIPPNCVKNANLAMLPLLIKARADINYRNPLDNSSLIFSAAKKGNFEKIQLLIDLKADVNIRGYQRNTPLSECMFGNQLECARLLLDNGADPNLTNIRKESPLSKASRKGHKEMVKLLIKFNAEIDS